MSKTVSKEAAISLNSLQKSFADEDVLRGIDLSIEDGEFFVIVGPSGSGKSTLLKCITGLHDIDSGSVFMSGEDVTKRSIQERDIGFIFQDFEERLFPHMTVRENVAFGLLQQDREYSADELDTRINKIFELLAISDLTDNKPSALSGGQQQRVELARQLVRQTDVLLLDDPLADLDYKLQKRMELEMRRIHKELESTFVYVTHNQDQALKLADRIAVLNQGRIEQIGPPSELYQNPSNAFVGRFIGDSNPIQGTVVGIDAGNVVIDTDAGQIVAQPQGKAPPKGDQTFVMVRPEAITLGPEARTKDNSLDATIEGRTYMGENTEFSVSIPGLDYTFEVLISGNVALDEVQQETTLGWDASDGICFDNLGEAETVTIDQLMEV